ncbi:RDD family protein [Thiovibrio sp. JS02]
MGNLQDAAYAGFWIRVWASVIDSFLLLLITIPLLLAVYGPAYFESEALLKGPMDFLINYLLPAVAIIAFWRYRAATPGKMAVSAKIVDADTGGAPSVRQLVIRYFAYLISTLPLGLGLLWVAFDPRKQSWHDKLAHTVVIRNKKTG